MLHEMSTTDDYVDMASTTHITVRVPHELRAKLQALADADRRTLSQYVALRLEAVVAEIERKEKDAKSR